MPARERRGCVTSHHRRLYLKLWSDDRDAWIEVPLQLLDTPANRKTADRRLAEVVEARAAQAAALGGSPGPVTVRAWAKSWFGQRERQGLTRVEEDRAKMEKHVLKVRAESWSCAIGDMLLTDVRVRHMLEVVTRMQTARTESGEKKYAPRTWRNVYYLARAMFRDAEVAELIPRNTGPCILTKRQLGKIRDKKPGWRGTAIYSRVELERLISDEAIPEDRRVWYALDGVGLLRTGEAAGLLWREVDLDVEPLGRMNVLTSYDDGETKTEVPRPVPIHPVLSAILAQWKLSGWARALGRQPGPDDLVCPVTHEKRKGRQKPAGSMRDRHYSWKRMQRDLSALGLRARRVHDLRRTGASLLQDDGAVRALVDEILHGPPADTLGLYTTLHWNTVCAEMAKLRLERRRGDTVRQLQARPHGVDGVRRGVDATPGTDEPSARNPRRRPGT